MSNIKLSAEIPNYGETNFITGMRAYAAMAVVLIHCGGAGLRELGVFFNSLIDICRSGVYVFFVISGYSVANSFVKSSGYLSYIKRRLWRIVPLYYLWITLSILLGVEGFGWANKFSVSKGFYDMAMHFSFLSFLDYRVANSIIGVEWSIPIEVVWYLFLPIVMRFLIRDKLFALVFIPLSLVLHYLALKTGFFLLISVKIAELLSFTVADPGLAVQWGPVRYFLPFFLGVSAYRLRGKIPFSTINYYVPLAALIAIPVYIAYRLCLPVYLELVVVSLITFMIILFGTQKDIVVRYVFTNPAAIYLGSISYGLYLSHIPVKVVLSRIFPDINATICFFIVASVATLISSLTYRFFEQPLLHYSANRLTCKTTP